MCKRVSISVRGMYWHPIMNVPLGGKRVASIKGIGRINESGHLRNCAKKSQKAACALAQTGQNFNHLHNCASQIQKKNYILDLRSLVPKLLKKKFLTSCTPHHGSDKDLLMLKLFLTVLSWKPVPTVVFHSTSCGRSSYAAGFPAKIGGTLLSLKHAFWGGVKKKTAQHLHCRTVQELEVSISNEMRCTPCFFSGFFFQRGSRAGLGVGGTRGPYKESCWWPVFLVKNLPVFHHGLYLGGAFRT